MQGLRILLVEDDGMISMLLSMMLEEMGFEVCATASTEGDAIREAERTSPDLIVTDMNLAQGTGGSAIAAICHVRPTPHVFISADAAAVKASKPDAIVLEKPFQYADLERAIGRAMLAALRSGGSTRAVAKG